MRSEQTTQVGNRVVCENGERTRGSSSHEIPPWITPALIADTIATWQPDYDNELTKDQAIQILITFDRLVSVLEEPNV